MSKERKMALRELDDELSELRRNITNANYMAQDIMEDYFEGIDAKTQTGMHTLAYEHPRYLSKMDILQQIIGNMCDVIKVLEADPA